MGEIEKIRAFLETLEYSEVKCGRHCIQRGLRPFVTISRETGAGGRSLAEHLMKALNKHDKIPAFQGWARFDQELCQMLENDPGLRVSLQSLLHREYRPEMDAMMAELIAGDSPQDKIIHKMFENERVLAGLGKVILVGWGSSCVTRNMPFGVHVRLVAPLGVRVRRIREVLRLDEKKAQQLIEEQDKSRALLVKHYFNRNIQDPLLYDIVWNTERTPIQHAAEVLVEIIRQKSAMD